VASVPSLAEIREWIGVPAAVMPDDQLQTVVLAELSLQAKLCDVGDGADGSYPAEAVEGLYRRVGRVVAARVSPLGMIGTDSEYGAARLPSTDAEITRVEAPIRRMVLG
jgi:hypothetical protein